MVTLNTTIEKRVRRAIRILTSKRSVTAVYVFGSQANSLSRGARRKPDKWSDIDVAVFIKDAEKLGLYQRARLSAMIQKKVGDDMELHFFSKNMLDHPAPASFARFVITKGIPLK